MHDSWKRDADAISVHQQFHDFWTSRWGGVEKMKKNEFSLGRCRRMHFWRSHAAWGSQKKRSPCSMGRPKPGIATPLERERRCLQIIRFCCCGFLSIWGRQTGILAESLKENLKIILKKKYMIFWKSSKWKMLLKPLVGARLRSEEVTTTNVSIWAPIEFLEGE